MRVGPDQHLTYCTNVHPGESLGDVVGQLEQHTVAIKRLVSPDQPFGVGLRLSAAAATELVPPESLRRFAEHLSDLGLYVFTLNGFPYGNFHGTPVKANVYEPDWTTPERVRYTLDLARILSNLLPEGVSGSISTVPGGFRDPAPSEGRLEQMARAIGSVAMDLFHLEAETGKHVALAIEPEPHCVWETTAEAVEFIQQHLLSEQSVAGLSARMHTSKSAAHTAVRRHVGLCLDACHAAVEFEDAKQSVDLPRRAGIEIEKLQISSGLLLPHATASARNELTPFQDAVYLHQVVIRRQGELVRILDLPSALERPIDEAEEWRVHFHVPVFVEDFGQLHSTRSYLQELLAIQRKAPFTRHLEVETYSFGVLPERHRHSSIVESVTRELAWAHAELAK